MKPLQKKVALIALTSLLIISCKTEKKSEPLTVQELPSTILLQEKSLYPEGIVHHKATQKTFVSSYYKGKIITVDSNGKMKDFVTDESLVAVVGMTIDNKNNRLLVCNSNSGLSLKSRKETIGRLAEVIAYDLTTGEKLKTVDLSGLYQGGHFLNDLITDENGATYITDSFSPVIYKIDQNYNASVLVSNDNFKVPQGTFGLNGIVYHKDNYLIVGKAFGGALYKIPLNNPEDVQEITLDTSVNSLDGLLLTDDNTLLLVSNYFAGPTFKEAVYKIETTNNWTSGKVINSFTDLKGSYPTTLTLIQNEAFVSFGYFTELIDPNSEPNDSFKLQKITFSK